MSVMHFQYPGKSAPGLKSALGRLASKFCAVAGGALLLLGGTAVTTPVSAQTVCGTQTWDLTAGQTIKVGNVTVSNDATNVYVTYTLNQQQIANGANFGTLHAWVGNDLDNLPTNPQGVPVPGQMPYSIDASGLSTYTFVIPFQSLQVTDVKASCPLQLFVVTHAEVKNVLEPDGGTSSGETAWGGDTTGGTGNRWWFYGAYNVCCEFADPPTTLSCTTAFAKGGWIFATDTRANPDSLPSLNLIRNRWGWAINLTAPGTYTYDIWAGAGLNNTAKGRLVGQLVIDWDGASASISYNLTGKNWLREVHIYAGDARPTKTAPGQYGYTRYFDPPVSTHTATLALTDTNKKDGVWLIAHAVVCR